MGQERVTHSKRKRESKQPWLPGRTRLCKHNKCSESSSREQQGTLTNEQWHIQREEERETEREDDLHACSTFDF